LQNAAEYENFGFISWAGGVDWPPWGDWGLMVRALERYIRNVSFQSLYGGRFALSAQLLNPKFLCFMPPPMQHHSFFRN